MDVYCRADGVEINRDASCVVARERHHDFFRRNYENELSRVAPCEERGRPVEFAHPKLPAVVRSAAISLYVRYSGLARPIFWNDLLALPFSAVQVKLPETKHVFNGERVAVSAVADSLRVA